jgi:hypothetical protein
MRSATVHAPLSKLDTQRDKASVVYGAISTVHHGWKGQRGPVVSDVPRIIDAYLIREIEANGRRAIPATLLSAGDETRETAARLA